MKTRLYLMLIVLTLSIAGFSIPTVANPLSVGSHFDYQEDEYDANCYGYHYIVTIAYDEQEQEPETAHDFYLFAYYTLGATAEEFTNTFLQSGAPGSNESTPTPYNFYQPVGWTYDIVYDGPVWDPVFTDRNDYVHWYATDSTYDIYGPNSPELPDLAFYFGFSNTMEPGPGAYILVSYVPYVPPPYDPIHVPAPEPATICLLCLGGLALLKRR